MKYQDYKRHALGPHRSPRAIEADVYAIRSEIIDTVTRLEDRFSPRKLLEQMMQRGRHAGEGGSQFMGNLGGTVRDNPVSTLMFLGGAAALLGHERSAARERTERVRIEREPGGALRAEVAEMSHALTGPHHTAAERARERGAELRGTIAAKGGELRSRGTELRERARERSTELRERARSRGTELRGRARERSAELRERARAGAQSARDYGSRTVQEEPLLLAAIGLSLGAVLGASPWLSERRLPGFARKEALGAGPEPIERTEELLADPDAVLPPVDESPQLEPVQTQDVSTTEVVIVEEKDIGFDEPTVPPDPDPGPPGPGGRHHS